MVVFDTLSIRFWHGGGFKHVANGELVYMGGKGKTHQLDPDELCYFDLIELAKNCGQYDIIAGIYFLVPGMSLSNGLRKVCGDTEVLQMAEIAKKTRFVDVYVLHCQVELELEPLEKKVEAKISSPLNASPTQPLPIKKLTPKRGPQTLLVPTRSSPRKKQPLIDSISVKSKSHTQKEYATSSNLTHAKYQPLLDSSHAKDTTKQLNPKKTSHSKHISQPTSKPNTSKANTSEIEGYDWEDCRPDSPLTLRELIGESDYSDEDDCPYQPELDSDESEGESDFDGDCEDNAEQDLELGSDEDGAVDDEGAGSDSETSDEEYKTSRERLRSCNDRIKEIAQQVVRDAGVIKSTVEEVQIVNEASASGYVSDYPSSEEDIDTPDSGEEDAGVARKRRGVLVSPEADFTNFRWKVGQRFATRQDFKDAVAKYAIVQGRDVSIVVSNKNRRQQLGVRCVQGCPFYLYSAWHSRLATYIVKRVDETHTCHRNMKRNRQLKSSWVAKQLLEVFKSRPHWPAREIQETIRRAFKVVVGRAFAYKVKYYAHRMLHGSMKDHYKKLGGYLEALKVASLGSKVELVTVVTKPDQAPVFQRLFTCYEGLAKGWKEGCRRVLCVDACFIKTFLGGQLLSAVSRDANEQMYPVAWAAVEAENNLSWEWFFINLQQCLELGDGTCLAIISDEHQAILNRVAKVLPKAEHRHCARHIFMLWHKSFRGDEMKILFWKIAKAYNRADYDERLEELAKINADAATAFKGYNPKLFCRAFLDSSIRTDAITNNMAETFNCYIVNARTKHLIHMLEDIRVALMQRLVLKRQEMQKSNSVICPRIQSRLEKEKLKAADCNVIPSSDHVFNVKYILDQLVVDLEAKRCTCRRWDMTGIPCCHAIACIFFQNRDAESFVNDCYKSEVNLKAYASSIPPCEGERHWPKVVCKVDPPPIKIGPGRPRKKRIKDPYENPKKPGTLSRVGMEMTCSICLVKGHNKRRCPNRDSPAVREPQPKKARGRPRLTPRVEPSTTSAATPSVIASTTGSTVAPITNQHHNAVANPSQLGRGGRMIITGQGARGGRGGRAGRGGSTSRGGRGGRGGAGRGRGKEKVPAGVGVYFTSDGNVMTNPSGGNKR